MEAKDLQKLGFILNNGLMRYELQTNSGILITFYTDKDDILANCFISTYSDTTIIFPSSIKEMEVIIKVLG